ncbi:DUF1501 domain-containing protein [Zavarzinella formosa]|uniref:DUF1501 domain-containing protein n=1 Tax=Zavarzinella formosa TaxID=360055 RepID=UPI0002FFC0BC|nr:DUF1501 domain-containing protein [Zavarzinella formosa]
MARSPLCTPRDHLLSRRQWLGATALAGASALAVNPLTIAAEAKKKGKQVLFVWLDGGLSQLESWDPKPNTPFGGPFRAIPTSVPGIHISELLPNSAKQMHHLALVRSLCTQDNSHSAGVERIQRGDPKNRGVTYPYFGSAVAKLLGSGDSGLPPYIHVKPLSGGFMPKDAGFLGPKFGALALGDGKAPDNLLRPETMTAEEDNERNELRNLVDQRYAENRRTNTMEATRYVFNMAAQLQKRRDLFDISTYSPKDVERYGKHEIGRHMLIARRMLEAGVTFVKVSSFGWDTHGDNFNGQGSLVPQFDQAFAAMISDLHERGMLEHTLVIAMSEFGRTPRINGHLGRDHWPEAWSLAMGGTGIKKGAVVGKTNDKGTFVATDEHDIGHLFHTWFRALGIDPKKTEYDNEGQPLPIAHEGCKPLTEALA